jgi:hypothetical protein
MNGTTPALGASVGAAGSPVIWMRLLGPVQAWRGGRALPPGPPQQLLLAMLALRAGTAVARDEMVDALRDRAPDSAVSIVHKHICVLRALLEPAHRSGPSQLLASVAGEYELRLEPTAIDAAVFGRYRAQAQRARAVGDLPQGHSSHGTPLPQPTRRAAHHAKPGRLHPTGYPAITPSAGASLHAHRKTWAGAARRLRELPPGGLHPLRRDGGTPAKCHAGTLANQVACLHPRESSG